MPAPGPKLPASAFTENFRQLNGYTKTALVEWLFLPGMKFGECEKWWQPGSCRKTPHEGLDLLAYRDGNGGEQRLSAATRIPPLLRGVLIGRCKDFLGETVILAHDFYDPSGRRLHTFYGHLHPAETPETTAIITPDSPLGNIAWPGKSNTGCPPHLHLSLAWVDQSLPMQDFSWDKFCASETFRPGDPLPLVSGNSGRICLEMTRRK